MNRIIFPLRAGMRGPEVNDLHEALQAFIDRKAIMPNDEAGRRDAAALLTRDRRTGTYEDGTRRLISIFQVERQIQRSGDVDEPTAAAINAMLKEFGLLDQVPAREQFVDTRYALTGRVVDSTDKPIAGLGVRAFHQEPNAPADALGQAATTDAAGIVTFKFKRSDFTTATGTAGPNVFFQLDRDSVALNYDLPAFQNDKGVIRNYQTQREAITIRVAQHYIADGRVARQNGLPADGLTLFFYHKEFGGDERLLSEGGAEPKTDAQGAFTLTYDPKGVPINLEVRIKDPQDNAKEIPLAKPRFNANPHETFNLVVGAAPAGKAEYGRLSEDLTPHVGQMTKLAGAKETKERQDLSVLNRATGWDARLIALAATAERLGADRQVLLPPEIVYGLLRAGLPSDKVLLAQVDSETAGLALSKVNKAGIVNLTDDDIDEFKTRFKLFADQTRLAVAAPGSASSYNELLASSGLPADVQSRFAAAFLKHRDDPAKLWETAANEGLNKAQVTTLQLQGKLAFLSGNSAGMTKRLMAKPIKDPAQLVDLDFHRTETWANELYETAGVPANRRNNLSEADKKNLDALIPVSYEGKTVEERFTAYTSDMSRKVRLSYPTQVVARQVEKEELRVPAAREATVKLIKGAAEKGFRFGETPVAAFISSNAGLNAGMTDADFSSAQGQMKTLQRVYQITPSNEAMPVLLALGMTSAYDVLAYSEEDFVTLYNNKYVELYGVKPSPKEPLLVRRKAKQVSSVTYNLFAISSNIDSGVALPVTSPTTVVREQARNELIKQFPTMESLFGSMDYCACEHCRTVLSPAAYLVDLLQFIDAEPTVWGNFLAIWAQQHGGETYTTKFKKPFEALIERRPDLQHIQLTCENTNTAMPYIDIVNEILEYFVANGKLEDKAAHDTGGATTAELLAEPQNVISAAYDKLRSARYPLTLPFDLSLETVRQFCNYFETPLAQVLEVFRPNDDLFATAQTYDRAAMFVESLGLTPAEAALFTNTDPLATWFELYGFANAADATTVATDAVTGQRIDLNSAKALSRRLGVTYQQIVDIVQTEFVNPKLAQMSVLYKLGVSIHDARFYLDNKGLLAQNAAALSTEDQKKRLEVEAFSNELTQLAAQFSTTVPQLEASLQAIPLNEILELADPDAGCNFDLTTLQYADGTKADPIAFTRINLFVRLWRKLGWTIEETDRALSTFVPKTAAFTSAAANLNKQPLRTALIHLAQLKALDEMLPVGKQSRMKLVTLWSDLATTGKNPLYAQLFLTRTALRTDDAFDHPLGQYLSAPVVQAMAQSRKHSVQVNKVAVANRLNPALFAAQPKVEVSHDALQEIQHLSFQGLMTDAEKAALKALAPASQVLAQLVDAAQVRGQEFLLIKGHLLALQGALGLTADEIERILIDVGKTLATAELSLPNVSLLYRYGLLAKALKLAVRDLITLKRLSGLDPFKTLHPDPLAALNQNHPFVQTRRFVEVANEVKESGLSIEDLEYLLAHRFDETGKYRPNREATLAFLKSLAEGLRALRAEHAVPEDPGSPSEEVLRQKLGLAMPPDAVETFVGMINGTAEFTATTSDVLPANAFNQSVFEGDPSVMQVNYQEVPRREQKLRLRGVLFDQQKADLIAKYAGTLTAAQQPIFAQLLNNAQAQARAFFDNQLKKQTLRLDGTAGFLDNADFELLFKPLKALVKILPGDTPQQITDKTTENENTEKQNQTDLQARRHRVAQAFMPYLQQRLIRQFIVQTMTAYTGGEPVLTESLLTDERLLTATAKPLVNSLAAVGGQGITATFFASTDTTGPTLATMVLSDADTGLTDKNRNVLRPPNARSARLEGYLEVPAPGAYRFYVTLGKQAAEVTLRFDHLPEKLFWTGAAAADNSTMGDKPAEYLELKAGVPYRFSVELRKLDGGDGRISVQGETLARRPLSQLKLYPVSVMDGAEAATTLLSKVLQYATGLGLNEREVRYLLTHAADFGNLNLSDLPTATIGNTAASTLAATNRFAQFLRLAGYARVKRDLAEGTDDLINIFEAQGTTRPDDVYPLIAKLTRRDEATVRAAARALSTAPAFASEQPLLRLWEALKVIERFGVPVGSLLDWTRIVSPSVTAAQRFQIAVDLKGAIKARFDEEAWQRVAQPIFDKLRQRQRDALVAHVMHQHNFERLEQLYEYFLIDPGMEPVVQTSRIRLAISSVQLFIQRCLLNLEAKVHPSVINSEQWEWMKRYRVWEANRKIFLFPENWLEPEFRDDKTHLFVELESALLEGDVSNDLVEDAFLNYLKKLDELARLEIVAMHLEDNADPAQRTLHVIGRTYAEPHKYFYRRFAHQMWTNWEPVGAEIEGDHLAPVIWRQRLYLFWITFLDQPEQPAGSSDFGDKVAIEVIKGVTGGGGKTSTPKAKPKPIVELTVNEAVGGLNSLITNKFVEVQLHWSEYLNGEWTTRESGGTAHSLLGRVASDFDRNSASIHVSKAYNSEGEESGVYIHVGGGINGAFFLAGRNSSPESSSYSSNAPAGTKPHNPYRANIGNATRFGGSGAFIVEYKQKISTEAGSATPKMATPSVLQRGSRFTILPCDNNITLGVDPNSLDADNPIAVANAIKNGLPEIAALIKPIFYQDNAHTLFVQPDATEKTLEEWKDWIPPATGGGGDKPSLLDPKWFDEMLVEPAFPIGPRVGPDDIMPGFKPDDDVIFPSRPKGDWLVNPSTGLMFDGVVIGPQGKPDVEIVSTLDGRGVIADGVAVNVSPGSGIAAGEAVVLTGNASLGQSGLVAAAGGLNVVGGAGFNTALAQNLQDNRKGFSSGVFNAGRLNR